MPQKKKQLPFFPVSVVGSLPRPDELVRALRQKHAGAIEPFEFDRIADRAVYDAIALQEDAGVDIVTDGEQRRENFYSFIADAVEGITLMTPADLLDHVENKSAFERFLHALDVPAFAIRNPVASGKLRRVKPIACAEFESLKDSTEQFTKVALPGPYLLTRSMWVRNLSATTYPTKESLGDDVVALLRAELTDLRDAGCDFVQFDEPVLGDVAFASPHMPHRFMCTALSEKSSPEEELNFAVELINRVVDGVDGIRTGLHVCRGNWSREESVRPACAYDALIPYFSRMNVGQFILEYATERAGSLNSLRGLPEEKEIGLGVVNPRSTEIESVEFITARVQELMEHRSADQIFLNPDCGFGTFSERPVNTPDIARAKLKAIQQAAETLREL